MSIDKNIRDEIQEELVPFMKISDEIIASRQRRRERQDQIKTEVQEMLKPIMDDLYEMTDQLEKEWQEQEQRNKK